LEGHTAAVRSGSISQNGQYALSGSFDGTLRLWEFDWDYDFPGCADWDEGARPYLETFLTLHCPCEEGGVSRVGTPGWDDGDFQELLVELPFRGYGWLKPEGLRKKLEEMAANWQGPPPLPWETK
jgi:hypothetical protein